MLLRLRISELSRHKRGWRMKDLAERLEVDYQTVCYWNSGRAFPHLQMLVRICQLLRCKVDDMIEVL